MRPWLWKTALVVVAVLLVGVVPPAAGQQAFVPGAQDPAGGRVPPPPPNDDFADAIEIAGPGISPSVRLTRTASVELCEVESGDPEQHPWLTVNFPLGLPWFPAGMKTIWWTWVPDRTGWVTVDTGLSQGPAVAGGGGGGGPFDTVLGVYQGGTCTTVFDAGLTRYRLVTWDDDSGRAYMSRVRFRAYEGARYYIVVDGGDRGGQTCHFQTYPVAPHVQCYPTVGGNVVVRLRNP